ncbi:MAG: Energy-coupling factor transporter transmembrane protein EcfT [Firmicutes bacterium ADurb.Bin506]|jgi:energy-coupling factor transport system permease protein|nr:MAG: Energy-coupling factor transporter transmembrane protein EcfT [Firmicutes bacterium ADurb.Bin506]
MRMPSVIVGQYIPGDSLLHRLDPRTKIMLSLAIVVALFSVHSQWSYMMIGVLVLVAVAASRVPFKMVVRGLRPIVFILLLTFMLHLFMDPGEELFVVWRLRATREGLALGLTTAARLILLIMATSLVTLTTSPIVFTDGLEKLLNPFRVIGLPAHELAMMMTIALRFIPTLLEETDKIMKAQMARGADFDSGGLITRAKAMIPILVPLFVSAFRRADELAVAMEARCYRGGAGRTRMRQLRLGALDAIAAVGVVAYLTAAVVLF